jgi:hypothetical protein
MGSTTVESHGLGLTLHHVVLLGNCVITRDLAREVASSCLERRVIRRIEVVRNRVDHDKVSSNKGST